MPSAWRAFRATPSSSPSILLVREPDITGFFRVFIKTLVEECESHACGVWLIDDGRRER